MPFRKTKPGQFLVGRDDQLRFVFTEEEMRVYLEKRGITDAEQMRQIRQLSRGLPLYLSMLTTNPEGHIDPTASVVENFLRWIPKQEAQKRQLALNAALFSLPFTKDDLAAFSYSEPERSELYHWLIGQPFVQYSSQDGRHIYHDLARDLFRRHLYQRSREDYYTVRKALAHCYQQRLEVLQAGGSKSIYTSRSWQELVFALIQQVFLLPDEESHLLGVEYVLRIYEHTTQEQDNELIRILNSLFSNEPEHQATMHAQSLVKHLLQHIELDSENHYQQWMVATNTLLENVSHIPTFPPDVIAYLYRRKGRAYRFVEDYQNALIERLTDQNEEYYRLRFNAALYLLVDGSVGAAEADYRELLSMCSIVSALQDAANDLEEFLAIQPANKFAQNMLVLVNKHIEEVKYDQSPS